MPSESPGDVHVAPRHSSKRLRWYWPFAMLAAGCYVLLSHQLGVSQRGASPLHGSDAQRDGLEMPDAAAARCDTPLTF